MMRAPLRYLLRALIGLLVLLLLATAGLTIYLRTESFNQLLVREVNGALQGRFRGQISIGVIRTPRLGLVEIHNVIVSYQGRELLRMPLIDAGYALIPILWHQVDLTILIDQPNVRMTRDSNGKWDLAEALESAHPSANSAPSAYSVTLSALEVSEGAIVVAPNGPEQPQYLATEANLVARIVLTRSGLAVAARDLSAHLVAPHVPPADLTLAATYDESARPATIRLTSLTLTTQNSSLSATATITDPASPTIQAQVTIAKLAPADLTLVHGYPLRDDLAGSIIVSGRCNALHTLMALTAGPARLNLDLGADLVGPQPVYDGTLGLARADLSRLALSARFAGQVDASVQMRGVGAQLDSIEGSVKADGYGLVVNQLHAGNINLTAESKDGRAQLAVTMRNGASELNANLSLARFAAPAVKAQIVTRHFDLHAVTGSHMQPKTDLNATLGLNAPRLDRANLNLAHLDAHLLLTLARSTIRNAAIANGVVDAGLRGGVVSLARMKVNAQGAAFDAQGRVGLIPHSGTQLRYTLHAPQLAPLLRMVQIKGDSSLDLSGTASGNVAGPGAPLFSTQGRAIATKLNINGLAAANADVSYDLSRLGQGGLPLGRAQFKLMDVAFATTRLRTLNLTTQFTRPKPAALNLALAIVDAQGHAHFASLSLATQGANVAGTLTELAVTAPDGIWRLAEPAHFVAGSRAITINQFDLRNGPHQLALQGAMRIAGPQAVSLTARNLDLGLIQPLLQPNQHPVGTLAADIAITGTAGTPIIRASLAGHDLAMNQQRIGDLNVRANYESGAANINIALYQDRTHQMTLTGIVPLAIDWARGFHLHMGNDVALRLYSAGLRLGGLAALAPPRTVKDATGQLAFDLAISGPAFHPVASGTLALDDLGGQVIPLGLKVRNSFAHMRITPDRFTVEQMVIDADSGSRSASGGSITASGDIALTNYTPGAVDLDVRIDQFPAVHTQQYQATIGGSLHLGGNPDAPDLTGNVEVLNATIHPDLAFLTASKYARDETIVVIRPGDDMRAPTNPNMDGAGNASKRVAAPLVHSSLFDQLTVDVAIIVHRNTWIRHPDASVELAGHLYALKPRGGALSLIGEIDTVRGWITFNSQTFTLVSGQILFTGGHKIDPSLDLDAQYTVSAYTIDVLVTGFASRPKLKLQSMPSLPQSDILSLLLFGKTSSSLGQGQSASLQQQAAQMAAGAAASTIGQSLASSLGLGELGIDVNSSSGNGVGVGRYIGKNTYLSASQSTTGRKVSIQYYIKRWISITTSTNADGSSEIFLNLIKQY
jgi:TamB, inner membrane protein subunit of TAM complex/AsmA family